VVSSDGVRPQRIAVTCGTFVVSSFHFLVVHAYALQAHITHRSLMIY